jgi:ribonuclease-3
MPVSYSKSLEKLEDSLGYSFKNKDLLLEALTHKSFHHENPGKIETYNERLEFIGDSVFGLVVVEYLFKYDAGFTESEMSKIKSYIVKGAVLSEIGAGLEIGNHLSLGRGEEDTGGRQKRSIVANATEALFGAVYLDSDYKTARKVILGLFRDKIHSVIASGQYHDYKTDLQEKSQMLYGVLPEYRLTRQEGEEHRKTFTVEVFIAGKMFGRGTGKNKKEAQAAAAKEALEKGLSQAMP